MEKKNDENTRLGHISMDGFVRRAPVVPRRIGQPGLSPVAAGAGSIGTTIGGGEIRTLGQASMLAANTGAGAAAMPGRKGVSRGDLDDSLKAIDGDKKKKPNKYDPYRRARRRRIIKRVVLILLAIAVIIGLGFAINALIVSSKIFKGNIFEALTEQNTPLAKDSYGRTNILVFGTSEDDPGHGGANLTDSIMILSIDQDKKTANMLSIPRDLWVQYDTRCSIGYAGKINAAYTCALESNKNDENSASEALVQKVDEVLNTDIQYYVHVNYTVVKGVVDAVGGVDVNIQSSDPRGILDRNFDWTCNYKCYLVKYPNGVAHLDGTHALALARARNDAGGYGLSRGNFDREQNQQKILKAVQAKVTGGAALANPINALNLMNSLGDNIRTNFQTKEITTLITLAKTIKGDDITSLDIDSTAAPLVTTGTGPDGSSIVKPVRGLLDYSGLQQYVKAIWSGDTSVLENATVAVYNGSQTAGMASSTATTLKNAGFNVVTVDDAVKDYTPKYTLYDQSGGKKPSTLAKLKTKLGVSVTSGKPSDVSSTADFVVIIGSGTASSGSSGSAQ